VRTTYGKLIRDRIPEVLEAEGLRYEVVPLDGEGFRAALLAKLLEEAGEAAAAADTDALANEGTRGSLRGDRRRPRVARSRPRRAAGAAGAAAGGARGVRAATGVAVDGGVSGDAPAITRRRAVGVLTPGSPSEQ